MRTLMFVFLIFALANAVTVDYSGNATFCNEDTFQFRETNLAELPTGSYSGAFYQSLSNGNGTTGLFSCFYGGALLPPTQYSAYFENASTFAQNNPATASVEKASAFIATTYLSLHEVSASGVIQSFSLIGGGGGANSFSWIAATDNGNGGLRTSTYSGLRGSLSVNLTVVYSDVFGVLDTVGGPIITPLSTQTIIEIGGFEYQNPANQIRLSMAVGTGETNQSFSLTGATQLTSGDGSAGTTFTAGNVVSADGIESNISVSIVAGTMPNLANQLVGRQMVDGVKVSPSVHLVNVEFPAGAQRIVWEISQAAGSRPPFRLEPSSSQETESKIVTSDSSSSQSELPSISSEDLRSGVPANNGFLAMLSIVAIFVTYL
eukprot:TRINITY_DN1468_c0_g1_i1.p1 TRINITY_DN1468_c0_g1~~TRINITY_DN1468_c0_g1_i1.p1  ORF type:complete len:388 (+),score=41.45 TRINITY_DN1468_c0_g1_i1:37-1164(+)